MGHYTVVLSNESGAVTSAPVRLNIIAPVPRRPVPALVLNGEPGTVMNLEFTADFDVPLLWSPLASTTIATAPQWHFDVSATGSAARFYRAWHSGPLPEQRLDLHLVPAITLSGSAGSSVRLDYINQYGPTDAWVTLATVALTNSSQLYFDTSMLGQPPRLYRIVPGP